METEPSKGTSSIGFQKDLGSASVNSCPSIEATVIPTGLVTAHSGCNRAKEKRCRLGVDYGVFILSSDDELDSEKPAKRSSVKPTQVHSSDNSKKQKACYRWFPKQACKPLIDEAPVFYPTVEEFEDTLSYIASIRKRAEPYGICRIVPPPSWKPPCLLKEKSIWESAEFTTHLQEVDKLQNRESMRKKSRNQGTRRERRCMTYGKNASDLNDGVGSDNDEKFGFQPGPGHTLQSFEKYANNFKGQYFGTNPSVDEIEGEYWRVVENSTEEVEVAYGADLETSNFCSGFPKASRTGENESDPYALSGWNLNNLPRLPGSVISFENEDISGVSVPWLYIAMCFSSFCWHVEDHHFYSLNYLHFGEPKVWYGVPGTEAVKLEDTMRKLLPHLFEEQPDLLHGLVTQLSPSVLKSEGVPVYRAVQKAGEFVLTFPRGYHSGFNCGFNCAEAVNVAPVDWLPHGQFAVELYREQSRKTAVSHDKLLLGAAREAVRALWELSFQERNNQDNLRWQSFCGKEGILAKAVKARVAMEQKRRECLCSSAVTMQMDVDFDSSNERECFSCFYDLHLSAAGCVCSPDRFACLTHSKQLCDCESSRKFYLFRYNLKELGTLVEALEGDLRAVRHWGIHDLGLVLPSGDVPGLKDSGKVTCVSLDMTAEISEWEDENRALDSVVLEPNKRTNSPCKGSAEIAEGHQCIGELTSSSKNHLRLSSKCESVIANDSSELRLRKEFANNLKDSSCSKDAEHISELTIKLFGVDLQQPGPCSSALANDSSMIDCSNQCPSQPTNPGKTQKLNDLRRLENAESSASSSVKEVERMLGQFFKKATAKELKVLQNVFVSGPGSNSWMAALKVLKEIVKQERSLKADLLKGGPRKPESCAEPGNRLAQR